MFFFFYSMVVSATDIDELCESSMIVLMYILLCLAALHGQLSLVQCRYSIIEPQQQ